MPRERRCDFCEADIEPGTGTMFVRTNGTTIHFCSSKCESNADLGREARDLEWAGEEEDETEQTDAEETEPDEAQVDGDDTEDSDAAETDTEEDEAEEAEVEADETETDSAADDDEDGEETEAEA